MEPQATSESTAVPSGHSVPQAQVDDLRNRIETLERLDESQLGEFNRSDWVICILGAIVIPSLALLWIGR
jgi:hypothetical protein